MTMKNSDIVFIRLDLASIRYKYHIFSLRVGIFFFGSKEAKFHGVTEGLSLKPRHHTQSRSRRGEAPPSPTHKTRILGAICDLK